LGVQAWTREAFQAALDTHLHTGPTLLGPWTLHGAPSGEPTPHA